MFYDKKGKEIREGSKVRFNEEVYTIAKITGDSFGLCGTSTVRFDRTVTISENADLPCEENIELVRF